MVVGGGGLKEIGVGDERNSTQGLSGNEIKTLKLLKRLIAPRFPVPEHK